MASSAFFSGRDGSRHVVTVPLHHLLQGLFKTDRKPFSPQFFKSSSRPLFGTRIQVELDLGIGEDDGPDVSSLKHDTPSPAHLPLHFDQGFPDSTSSRNIRGKEADLGRSDRLRDILSVTQDAGLFCSATKAIRREQANRARASSSSVETPFSFALEGNGPIHGSCIDINVMKAFGQGSRHRALSGTRGAVDGDDETSCFWKGSPFLPVQGVGMVYHIKDEFSRTGVGKGVQCASQSETSQRPRDRSPSHRGG